MKAESTKRLVELTDAERASLSQELDARDRMAKSIGFALRGTEEAKRNCVVADIPDTPSGEMSVCGAKDFLIDEVREFLDNDGEPVQIRCAAAAVLEMTDAPIHVHGGTVEYYIVLAGSGKMVLGNTPAEEVVPVQEGSVILLPPGQAHGIVSDDPDVPVKALLTFFPGMAPKNQPAYRDEKIIHPRTSTRLMELSP